MKNFVHEKSNPVSNSFAVEEHYDVAVVGGGLSGMCAAIAAARHGAKTVIIQDRSVYGGNCSSEIRMVIMGASCHSAKKNAHETGILMELELENKYLNDSYNYSIWDGVLWSKIKETENLNSYMNTTMEKVFSDGRHISAIECYQMTTEKHLKITADIFVDATGHGSLAYFAGNEYCIGCEDKKTFNEEHAPEKENGNTMGNSILFVAHDTGHPVKFIKPKWARSFPDETYFKHRYHGESTVVHTADDVIVLKKGESIDSHPGELVEQYDAVSGYWWVELGGDWDDIISQSEDIRWELYRTIYGIWDHIKNQGDHGAENYELDWFGNFPGWRESRRIMGKKILTEQDIVENRIFEDGVAYGGWPMDQHVPGGFEAVGSIPSVVRSFPGLYSIPYGCYCAKDIDNLMLAGRDISCSKLAMGSTRVMGTCAVGGQAVGTAAAMAVSKKLNPEEFGKKHIQELRQQLLKDDLYILGLKNNDPDDLALKAKVTATSQKKGFEAGKVINGISRNTDKENNEWISDGIGKDGEVLTLKLDEQHLISQVRLTFDPDLSAEYSITIVKSIKESETVGVPERLVKDYDIELLSEGKTVAKTSVRNNHQRHCISDFKQVLADEVRIKILSTNGCKDAMVYEVRVY